MKKIFYFLFLIVLASCSQDNLDVESSNILSESPILKGGGDGKYDVLGHGCDITGDYYTPKAQVIDSDLTGIKKHIYTDSSYVTDEFKEVGTSAEHYLKSFSKKKGISIGGSLKDSVASGKVTLSKTFIDSTSYSISNAFASIIKYVHIKSHTYGLAPKDLVQFASPSFKNAIKNNYTPQEMIRIFGTHVYTNVKLGGKLVITYRGEVNSSSSDRIKTVTTNASFIYGKLFNVNVSGSTSTYEHEQAQKEVNNFSCHIQTFGGGDGFVDKTITEYDKVPDFDYKKWSASVNPKVGTSLKIYDFDPNTLIPLWEFVEEGPKREELKAAIIKYVKENELKNSTSSIKTVEFYQYYSSKCKNHFYSTWLAPGGEFDSNKLESVAGRVYSKQKPGTVPLYYYYSSKYIDHHFSLVPTATAGSTYAYQGIACYVYTTQQPGTVPFYQFYHSKDVDYYYTRFSSIPTGYVKHGIVCYIYPPEYID